MKSNLHRRRLGRRVVTISMAWRAETPCGAFGLGHCEWNGKLAAVTNANGLVAEYAYDVIDRVTNIAWRTTGGAALGGFAYEYDAVGRIVSRTHTLGNLSQMSQSSQKAYAYDVMDRLASDGGVAYTYDAAGNRMTKTENGEAVIYTLGAGDRLASYGRAASPLAAGGGSYTYDAAGNVTRIVRDGSPTLDLVWNGQYQLVSVSTNGVFAEGYAYDALGRRAATTTREGTTRHVYDEGWQVVADIDGQGNVLASYVWGEGIDRLLAVRIGGESYYPLTDVQGTVWGYVDSQNNIVARWQYDAWGNVVDESVSVPALAALRYRFQGREWSAATGLTNFRMRWYDSVTGRWLSKDPIGLTGGLNLYVFCDSIPVFATDSLGTSPFALFLRPSPLPRFLFESPPKTPQLPKGSGIPEGWKPSADPLKPKPPSGFEFRGPPGKGSYYNPQTRESLRPDLNHPKGIKPHWDHKDPSGNWWRRFPDGSIEEKSVFPITAGKDEDKGKDDVLYV